MMQEWWQLEDDRNLAVAIDRLDDDPWSLVNIRNSDLGTISTRFFELMQRIRALESELRQLKGG